MNIDNNSFLHVPDNAIIVPYQETDYLAIWQTNDKLKMRLSFASNFIVALDKKILPDLVDALIELQNQE